MESRKSRFDRHQDYVEPEVKKRLQKLLGKLTSFAGVHVFTPSQDIPDEIGSGPRLVVLESKDFYSKGNANQADQAAQKILEFRGSQPRNYRNRLLFLAAEADAVTRMQDSVKSYLAWKSIVEDFEGEKLILDNLQIKQARQTLIKSEQELERMLRETYRRLLCPIQEVRTGKPSKEILFESLTLSATASNLNQEFKEKLQEEEWLIEEWGAFLLHEHLKRWYFTGAVQEISCKTLWQDLCQYLYFPRLKDEVVFKECIARAVESQDYFAYAAGKEEGEYFDLTLGSSGFIEINEASLLLSRETAQALLEKKQAEEKPEPVEPITSTGPRQPGAAPKNSGFTQGSSEEEEGPVTKDQKTSKYYGVVDLKPAAALHNFEKISDEILQKLVADPEIELEITVDIRANSKKGFSEETIRMLRENSKALEFKDFDV